MTADCSKMDFRKFYAIVKGFQYVKIPHGYNSLNPSHTVQYIQDRCVACNVVCESISTRHDEKDREKVWIIVRVCTEEDVFVLCDDIQNVKGIIVRTMNFLQVDSRLFCEHFYLSNEQDLFLGNVIHNNLVDVLRQREDVVAVFPVSVNDTQGIVVLVEDLDTCAFPDCPILPQQIFLDEHSVPIYYCEGYNCHTTSMISLGAQHYCSHQDTLTPGLSIGQQGERSAHTIGFIESTQNGRFVVTNSIARKSIESYRVNITQPALVDLSMDQKQNHNSHVIGALKVSSRENVLCKMWYQLEPVEVGVDIALIELENKRQTNNDEVTTFSDNLPDNECPYTFSSSSRQPPSDDDDDDQDDEIQVKQKVFKNGRTTGLTSGRVATFHCLFNQLGDEFVTENKTSFLGMKRQILIEKPHNGFCSIGDSGAAVFTGKSGQVIGVIHSKIRWLFYTYAVCSPLEAIKSYMSKHV